MNSATSWLGAEQVVASGAPDAQRGLITREGRADDRRGADVDLTATGRAALAAAAPGHAELVRATVFDGMSGAELRALGSLTDRVLGRLG